MYSNYPTSTPTTRVHRAREQSDRFSGPLNPARQFALLTQLDLLPAMLVPVLWAASLAWWQLGTLDVGILALSLLGQAALALSLTSLVHYHDHRRSRQYEIMPVLENAPTGFQLLVSGTVQPGTVKSLGLLFFTTGVVVTIWLTYLVGWPLLFFGWLGLLLTYTYATPPVNYGYRGWGLGELGLLVGFGLLPTISTFYAQTQTLNWLLLWSSLPLSLIAVLSTVNHGFLHWRRDWKLRKMTLMVMIGPQRTLDLFALLVLMAFATIVLLVGLGMLPILALLGLAALPLVLGSVAHLQDRQPATADYTVLVESTANASVLFCTLLVVALWLDKLF
jgi:1,4-dihydroxy-2-naphthoate polyprenyltransferase